MSLSDSVTLKQPLGVLIIAGEHFMDGVLKLSIRPLYGISSYSNPSFLKKILSSI